MNDYYGDATADANTIADALKHVALQLKYLGNGDAATTMGALEHIAMKQAQGLESVASALHDVADAIREHA